MNKKIEELIRKLHAKAIDPNISENEAEIFMQKVQELLIENNLSDDVLNSENQEDVPVNREEYPMTVKTSWFGILAKATATLYFSDVIWKTKHTAKGFTIKKDHFLSFVGREHNRKVAIGMFDYFMKTMKRLSREKYDNPAQRNDYIKGFSIRLASRILTEIRKAKDTSVPSSNLGNLPALYNSEAKTVALYMENLHVKKANKTSIKATNEAMQGYRDAENVSLNNQIDGKSANLMIGV
jgi:hypothetical protein